MQLAEGRIALDHPDGRVHIQMFDELLGRAVLDGGDTAVAREQPRTGEVSQGNGHAFAGAGGV
jgi:hypothetical protein